MRFNLHGIAIKLILFILTGCLLIFAILFGYSYSYSEKIIFNNIQDIAENVTLVAVNKIETVLRSVQEVPQNTAYLLEHVGIDDDKLRILMETIVDKHSEIYGMAVAYEPGTLKGKEKGYSPYFYRDEKVHYKDLASGGYDYTKQGWFRVPKSEQKALWSEPYYDRDGGEIMMATYSVPFYSQGDSDGEFQGVVTADISLAWLKNVIASLDIPNSGYAFIISRDGFIVHHPETIRGRQPKLLYVEEIIDDLSMKAVMRKMLGGESGFVSLVDDDTQEKIWISFAQIQSSNWSIGVIFPREELMAATISLHKTVVILGLMGFIVLFSVISLIASSITQPLRLLAGKANEMSDGNLDVELPRIKSRDEVGALARSFVNMRDSLKKYICELTATTAEKQRLESELEIAKHIQMSMVPRTFPPFPERKEIDIYATLIPAKQVGGDLYEYFFLDDDRICLIIGDVAGKGVPAALFMAKSVTLLKATAREMNSPADIMQHVNGELAYENDSCIFVTAFLAILNTRTGELIYANGGHNPPFILRRNNEVQLIDGTTSPALAAIDGSEYSEGKASLSEGDILFMYTDGVNEAFDKNNNEFSDERLLESISGIDAHCARDVVDEVLKSVRKFSDGATQSDDITMLAIRYLGSGALEDPAIDQCKRMSIVLENKIGELVKLSSVLKAFGDNSHIPKDVMYDVALVIEELFTNAVSYGYEDSVIHTIKIDVGLDNKEIRIQMEDDAIAFNPLEAPEIDIEKPIEKREIGGLGLHLVREMVDNISYERVGNKNIIRIICKT
jgi:phosphoserine phosphatase RsbU/P